MRTEWGKTRLASKDTNCKERSLFGTERWEGGERTNKTHQDQSDTTYKGKRNKTKTIAEPEIISRFCEREFV